MNVGFTVQERVALYGLLAENSGDIILKSDERGFIQSASQGIDYLGYHPAAALFGPHVRELVLPDYADAIEAAHEAALAGRNNGRWIELPANNRKRGKLWFEVQMRGLLRADGEAYGVLTVMRSIAERKSLEDRLFAAELTDPLTRLTNRIAFVAMLDHLVASPAGGCLALFDLDHFMTLNMRYGQSAGDEMLRSFAALLRSLTRSDDIVSRIGGERFGVLLPGLDESESSMLCQPVIETLAQLGQSATQHDFAVTTSAGIAPIGHSVDRTMKRAEVALFLAKARGRSRIEASAGDVTLMQRQGSALTGL